MPSRFSSHILVGSVRIPRNLFLWQEHSAHILGALPYLLLLACPLMHYFMHGGHGGHGSDHKGPRGPNTGAGGQP